MGLNVSNGAGEATGRAVSSAAITEANSLQINGIEIGASASASASDKAAAINAVKDKTGVEATGFTQLTVDLDLTSVAGADEQIVINGSTIDLDSTQGSGGTQFDRLDQVVTAINAAGLSGVVASANDDGKLLLTSDTGQTITIADEDGNIGAVVDQSGNSTADVGTAASGATVALGNITLKSTNGGDVKVSGSEADAIGFTAQGGNEEAIGSGLSVTSAANASNSIERIDGALAKIDKSRSELGAVQNRFESTISNLQNVSQNLSAARSRIQDADFAQETTNLSRAQILSQAGTSMLAQANASKQNLLSLLG
ncbi:MAG: flagellin [Amphritea sp.]|nr:flagellin [Amphritea sp.]